MVMLNDLDRFHLVIDVIDRVPGLADARRRTCARRWSSGGCRRAPTRASTATTTPRSATGPGRTERPRRQRRLDQPQAVSSSTGTTRRRRRRLRRPARCGRPPRRPRRRALRRARADRRRGARRDRASSRALAPLHNAPALAAIAEARPRSPTSRTSPSSTPPSTRTHPGRGGDLRDPARAGARSGASGATASTGSPSQSAAEQVRAERLVVCHLGGGCSVTAVLRRPLGRHDDGLHAARGRADGDALRLGRSRRAALPPARARPDASTSSTDALEHESGLAALGGLDDPLGFAVYTYRDRGAVARDGHRARRPRRAGVLRRRRREPRRRPRRGRRATRLPRRLRRRGRPAREELVIARAVRELLAR